MNISQTFFDSDCWFLTISRKNSSLLKKLQVGNTLFSLEPDHVASSMFHLQMSLLCNIQEVK